MHRGLVIVVLALAAGTASGIAKPNFTGAWKLAPEKSDFGAMPAPEKFESKIAHSDPDLKVATIQIGQQGETTTDWTFNTEGKETENSFLGNPAKSTATWEGDTLVLVTKMNFGGIEIVQRMTLSEEGKTLTSRTTFKTPQGDMNLSFVFAKQ